MIVMKRKDGSAKFEAEDANDYVRSFFTIPVPGHCQGSIGEVKDLYHHNDKGCMEDPYKEMHMALDTEKPCSGLFCLRGESMVDQY